MMTISPSLNTWLAQQNPGKHQLTALAGDASFRKYFRLTTTKASFIVMDASKERLSCKPFIAIANALRQRALHTPDIIAADLDQGFLLLTDFGDDLYLKILNSSNADELYTKAINALATLQQCELISDYQVPAFTAQFARAELDLFREWFLEKHLALTLLPETQQQLNHIFDFLADNITSQPQVFMHRDYHSANLMRLDNGAIGILDFQDAFIGPVTYDLVSLLRDCYIDWPEELVNNLVLQFLDKAELSVEPKEFLRWFDLMGIQRHLKALLTFSRKFHRDNQKNYLQHIPRTVEYVVMISQRYPECHSLFELFKMVKTCVQ